MHNSFSGQNSAVLEKGVKNKMNPSNSLVIETHNLGKTYKGVQVLKDLNLKVPQHSIFGFLGPNGAGKTTTMKILLGLIRPTSGGGRIFGHDIGRKSVAIRERIGYLPQQPRFISYMTARENLRFTAGFFFSGPRAAIEDCIQETLELVELGDKADRPVKGFSGGEMQRLGLAQAQINYPDLLVLDEPAAALDPLGRHDVLEVMERLRKHTTIFYSTHILDDVQRVSDTVAILNRGQLVACGPIDEMMNSKDSTVFTITERGSNGQIKERLQQLSWVTQASATRHNGSTIWQVGVSDEAAAEAHLLRHILADETVVITDFNRKKYDLEEIFMDLVEGDNHER
jgi:ABC-2 type transport system ATP-binding protein